MTARTSSETARDIPEATVARLPVYLRALTTLSDAGTSTCSSEDLASAAGVNSAKLRKDLSYLGSYGTRGVGYDVEYLRYQIAREIGVTQDWPVVIVGIGNLGHALANYSGFRSRGFRVVALLDADPAREGEVVAGVEVRPFDDLEQIVSEHDVAIGVIATPALAAQDVADRMVACGITSILNFAPSVIAVPDGVDVRKVDLSIELQILAYHEQRKAQVLDGAAMSVLVVGISHNSAPVALLERVALDDDGVHKLISDAAACEHVTEATVIATCNRVEIYTEVDRFHGSVETLSRLLVERAGETTEAMLPHLYVHYDDGAVSHLFQVAAGLDSMAVGEGQILGQTREALRLRPGDRHRRPRPQRAVPAGAAGRQALPRRDRHRPGRAVAGQRRARPLRRGRRRRRRQARRGGRRRRDGRPRDRHRRPARRRPGPRGQPHRRPRRPPRHGVRRPRGRPRPTCAPSSAAADILITCTGATGTLISRDMLAESRTGDRPLSVIDLALPHDVDPAVAVAARRHPDRPGPARRRAARRARPAARSLEVRRIVGEEVTAFLAARRQASVTPTVVALRSMATAVVDAEMARLEGRLPGLDDADLAEIRHAVRRVADKLLHEPTVRVKELANEHGAVSYAAALAELFALDPEAVDAVTRPEGLAD